MHKSLRTKLWIGGVTAIGVVSFLYPFILPPKPLKVQQESITTVDKPVPDFAQITNIKDKKLAFFQYIAPEVQRQNNRILNQRSFVLNMRDKLTPGFDLESLTLIEKRKLDVIAKEYDVKFKNADEAFFHTLLLKVDAIPIELVLVQAANESAWGTSRFARLGYNFFGMWCFKKGCGFVPLRRNADMQHEVAKYSSLSEGVGKYLNTLNRHFAYSDLRYIRSVLRNTQQPVTAEFLAEGLLHYSERGQAYVEELQSMIRVNRKYMPDV